MSTFDKIGKQTSLLSSYTVIIIFLQMQGVVYSYLISLTVRHSSCGFSVVNVKLGFFLVSG